MRSKLAALVVVVGACGSAGRSSSPAAPPPPPPSPPLYAHTEPAPSGSALRVFAEPGRLIGWIAGSRTYAGATARVRLGASTRTATVDDDNTFVLAVDADEPGEAVVEVATLVQHVALAPAAVLEPAALFVVERSAYRPGQKLQFAAFLRRPGPDGAWRGDRLDRHATVKLVSDTKHTTATTLTLPVDDDGKVTGAYTFSPADPLDRYTLSIDGYRGRASVELAQFRKPKVALEIAAEIGDRGVTLTFSALDFLDAPVAGGRVAFTAQLVRDPRFAPAPADGELDPDVFAHAGPAFAKLVPEDLLALAADPAGDVYPRSPNGEVVSQHDGKVDLDAKGRGRFEIPLASELLRGHHRLLVDATIVDANGQELRRMRSIPLARTDVRLELAAPGDLVTAGTPIELGVRVVAADGKQLAPDSASVAAIRLAPPIQSLAFTGYLGNSYFDSNNYVPPNGSLQLRGCQFTNAGCLREDFLNPYGLGGRHAPLRSARRPAPAVDPTETLAATTAVVGQRARVVLDGAGAYRLVASARLADGSSVWNEVGVAVRAPEALAPLALRLDRADVRQGDRLAGRIESRYRDARVLVIARDAHGIRSRRAVALAGGRARFELPTDELGFGAIVEAMVLEGGDPEVFATQAAVRVAPAAHELAIQTSVNSPDRTYAPGGTVELGIAVERAREPIDLVVAVYDQSVLAVAPDRAVDPVAFFFADERLRTRAGLAALRGELGDLAIGTLLDRARGAAKAEDDAHARARDAATRVLAIASASGRGLDAGELVTLLRYAGVRAARVGFGGWRTRAIDPARLAELRLVDLIERDAKGLVIESIADTVVLREPGAPNATAVAFAGGAASGNAFHSAGGNMAFSAPVPAPMTIAGPAVADGVIRRDFSDSAFWTVTRTDPAGKARVTFTLPDSITNWQVVVTAVARPGSPLQQVGRAITRLRTVRDVMIWPMLPRGFTEGDVVSVFGTVHNLGDTDRTIRANLATEQLDVLSPATVTVRVPRGASVPVVWSVRVPISDTPDRVAQLLMSVVAAPATAGGVAAADASLKRVPIAASAAEQVVTASGFASADRPLELALPAGIDPRQARLELTFAPSLAADMVDTLDYLVEYPYGCAEQTMSRFAPAIRVAGILDHLHVEHHRLREKLPGVVDAGLKRLAELQQPDGGWGWQGHAETHEMITPYVVWGLLEAEHAGYALPRPDMVDRGLARVHTLMRTNTNLSDRAYLAYVYTHRHRVDDAVWRTLVDARHELSDYALALVLETAVRRKDADTADALATMLRARARKAGGAHWETGRFSRWMDDPSETTAVALKALVAHDPEDPLIPDVIAYFVATKRGDRWNSTKDTAMILYALTDLVARQGAATTGRAPSVDFTVDGGTTHHLAFADGLAKKITIAGVPSSRTRIAFRQASPGMMARAVLRYRDRGKHLAPAATGLDVARTMYLVDASGKRLRKLASGDRVRRGAYLESEVVVTHEQRQPMQFLLVEDPRPAGAEALPIDDPRFPRVPRPWVLREDRESHLAFHHQQVGPTTSTRTFLHLELAGELVIAPAQAELMYQTRTRGHSGSFVLAVD